MIHHLHLKKHFQQRKEHPWKAMSTAELVYIHCITLFPPAELKFSNVSLNIHQMLSLLIYDAVNLHTHMQSVGWNLQRRIISILKNANQIPVFRSFRWGLLQYIIIYCNAESIILTCHIASTYNVQSLMRHICFSVELTKENYLRKTVTKYWISNGWHIFVVKNISFDQSRLIDIFQCHYKCILCFYYFHFNSQRNIVISMKWKWFQSFWWTQIVHWLKHHSMHDFLSNVHQWEVNIFL